MLQKYLIKIFIGFSYGCSFPLTMTILDYWLKDLGFSATTIGLFAFVHWPFALKFFWGAFIDNVDIPILSKNFSRRKSWLIFSYILLICGILIVSASSSESPVFLLIFGASLIALADGCKNVVMYPYQLNDSNEKIFGFIASNVNLGHRIGAIFTKVAMLHIAHFFNWHLAYIFAAIVSAIVLILLLNVKEPKISETYSGQKRKILISLFNAWSKFINQENSLRFLAVICLYKSADFMIQKMSRVFFLEIGFLKSDIANIVMCFGSITVIVGGFLGGALIKKFKIQKSMSLAVLCHYCVFPLYLLLLKNGASKEILTMLVACEALTGGFITTAFISFFYKITADGTTFALLWAIHEFSGMIFSSISGIFVSNFGWNVFFAVVPFLAIPNLILLSKLFQNTNQQS